MFRGSDNLIRSVELRLPIKVKATKKSDQTSTLQLLNVKKPTFIRRWVEKICILEANPAVEANTENEEHEERIPSFDDRSDGDVID